MHTYNPRCFDLTCHSESSEILGDLGSETPISFTLLMQPLLKRTQVTPILLWTELQRKSTFSVTRIVE